jgi:hypothetical protein
MQNAIRSAFTLKMAALGIVLITWLTTMWKLILGSGEVDITVAILAILTMITFNGVADLIEAFVVAKYQADRDE